jgi:hypothetical protein
MAAMPDDIHVTEFALPGILQEIARFSTPEVAIAMAREWGGRRVYVPRTLSAGHRLARIIGRKAALLLCAHYGGEQIDIPGARTYLRWYDARRLKAAGKSHPEISKAIGIGLRQVQILLKGFEPGDPLTVEAQNATPPACAVCGHKLRAPTPKAADPRQFSLPLR